MPASHRRLPAFVVAAGVAFALAVPVAGVASSAVADTPVDDTLIVSVTAGASDGPSPLSLLSYSTATGDPSAPSVDFASSGASSFTMSGSSDAGGFVSTAADGSGVVLGGFGIAADPSSSDDPKDDAGVPRLAGFVDDTGAASTIGLGDTMNGGIRSVATPDGHSIYAAGNDASSGVVLATRGSDDAPVPITDDDKNVRTVGIVDGGLYVTSDKTTPMGLSQVGPVGTGLPTGPIGGPVTSLVDTSGTFAKATPNGFVLLDASPSVAGVDVAYVLVEKSGIAKYDRGADGSWTYEGLIAAPTAEALAGRALPGGGVVLYTVDAVGVDNHVIQYVDTAAGDAAPHASAARTVATAPAGGVIHGVTIAPSSWDPQPGGTGPSEATLSVAPASTGLPLAIGDPGNVTTMPVTVSASDGDVAGVSLSAAPTGSAVTGATVTAGTKAGEFVLSVTPGTTVGYSPITLTATRDGATTGTATVKAGLSGDASALPGSAYLAGAADASSAIDVGDGYLIVADDETDTLRLYNGAVSGAPVKTWNFNTVGGFSGEGDLEAAARVGDTVYWFGSHSNKKDGSYDSDRDIVFTTTVSGSGAATELSYGGSSVGLREDLIAWDAAHGDRLGLDADCTLAGGTLPDVSTGCNIEGFETAPGSDSVGYLGFRAPVIDGKALIVPLLNLPGLIGSHQGAAKFGDPITLDLGGRSIREIRNNTDGQYLITAGAPDDAAPGLGWALYRWNGLPSSAPVFVRDLPTTTDVATTAGSGTGVAGQEVGSWESIGAVPDLDAAAPSVRLLTDNGTTAFYGDDTAGKDQPAGLQKDRATTLTLPATRDPLPAASFTSHQRRVKAGGGLGIQATGFAPGDRVSVVLHSAPVTLATVTADGTGAISVSATIPADTAVGAHTLTVTGDSGVTGSQPLVVDPATGGAGTGNSGAGASGAGASDGAAADAIGAGGALADTGSDATLPLALAAVLLAAGAAGLVLTRRRRRADA